MQNLSDEEFMQALNNLLSEEKRKIMSESCKSLCGSYKPAEKIASLVFNKILEKEHFV